MVKFEGGAWLDRLGRDWSDGVKFTLPDKDVFAIDANAPVPSETKVFNSVGTLIFNMVVDPTAPSRNTGTIPAATHEQLWSRLQRFLDEVLPVAEKAGVRLALHPDDPPMPTIRGQPRLVYQPSMYQKVIDLNPSPANQLEFCVGSLAEMTEGDIYEVVDQYSRQNRLGYVHLRNVRDKVPHYKETFIDDGEVDVLRVLAILKQNKFDGVIIPDHAPQMSCAAPWHAGMAFAMGYLKAGIQSLR